MRMTEPMMESIARKELRLNRDITLTSKQNIQELTIKRPNSSFYYIKYLIQYNTLYVTGDVGNAIYQWSDQINFNFISNCNIDYFKSKCVASEHGRKYEEWDPQWAKYQINKQYKKFAKELEEGLLSHDLMVQYLEYSLANYDLDTEQLCALSNIGFRTSIRCVFHLTGIKLCKEKEIFGETNGCRKNEIVAR